MSPDWRSTRRPAAADSRVHRLVASSTIDRRARRAAHVERRAPQTRRSCCSTTSSSGSRTASGITGSVFAVRRRRRSPRRSTCAASSSAASFSDWRKAAGRIYLRLDYADVAAWSEWIPMPVPVQSGQGAMRVWFEFADGAPRDVVADLELADVRTRARDRAAPLDLAHLSGRVTWQQEGVHRALTTRGLELVERNGASIAPTNLDLRFEVDAEGRATSGRIASSRLELGPLSQLAAQLPLPAQVRDELARHAPQGTLSDAEYAWEGPVGSPATFRMQRRVRGPRHEAVRVASRIRRAVGPLRRDASRRHVAACEPQRDADDAESVRRAARSRQRRAGASKWERAGGDLSVRLDDVQYANAHLAGTAHGTWKSTPKGPGEIDLTARLSRADARQVHRYLPNVIGSDTRIWLRDSVLDGNVDDARLTLKGDLARFPFADGKARHVRPHGERARCDARLCDTAGRRCPASMRRFVSRAIGLASPRRADACSVRRSAARRATIADLSPAASGPRDRRRSERPDERVPAVHPVEPGVGMDRTLHRRRERDRQRQARIEGRNGAWHDGRDAEGRGRLSVQSTTSCGFPACPRWVP